MEAFLNTSQIFEKLQHDRHQLPSFRGCLFNGVKNVFSNNRTDSGTLCSCYNVATLRRFNLNSTSFIRHPSLQRFLMLRRQPANTLHEVEYVFRISKIGC